MPESENIPSTSGQSPVDAPLRYDEATDPGYAERAAASFDVVQIRDGVVLSGNCPRCADPMKFPYVNRVYRGLWLWPSERAPTPESTKLPMICTCEEGHPGCPPGLDGCGAYWNLTMEISQ